MKNLATHAYGLLSLIISVVAIGMTWQSTQLRDILLYSAGWLAAFMFALFLRGALRSEAASSSKHSQAIESENKYKAELEILKARHQDLKRELTRRNNTLDLIAGLAGMPSAKVREVVDQGVPESDHNGAAVQRVKN